MRIRSKFGGFIAILLISGAIVFCVWISPLINKKLAEINGLPMDSVAVPHFEEPASADDAKAIYLALGNPSRATANKKYFNNLLLVNRHYAVSYNRSKSIPNWVAWQLTKEDMGQVRRQNDFRSDERLPDRWKKTNPRDFSRSGYTRGHMVPSADRTSSRSANRSTFLMSNMVPQTSDLNNGPWEKLERYTRSLARRSNDLYIYSGCYGEIKKIRRRITVPTNCWKVIVAVRRGSEVDFQTRVIAVDMPNIRGIKSNNWRSYKTTVDEIENSTGFDLLSALPEKLQETLESSIDGR